MVTLRCTQKLMRRLGVPRDVPLIPPTTALGDWYANLLYVRPHQLVLGMNERSLLLVLVPAREAKSLHVRLREAALSLLSRIGVSATSLAAEAREMNEVRFGPTANRRVVGCMREAAFALSLEFESQRFTSLEQLEDYFSEFIYSTTGYREPRELALELLTTGRPATTPSSARVH